MDRGKVPALIVLPGIGGSGEGHWQTLWERSDATMRRFSPPDWDEPQLDEWCGALQRSVEGAEQPPVLVAHSLGCLLVAHWAARSSSLVAGAFMVAVPDPESPQFPSMADSFGAAPAAPLRFPSVVIASTDDPYGSAGYARRWAEVRGSRFVNIGAFGHINAASNVGEWEQGKVLLNQFCGELGFEGLRR